MMMMLLWQSSTPPNLAVIPFKLLAFIATLLSMVDSTPPPFDILCSCVLAITKFKIRYCILMTDSPNLMLAKVSHYSNFSVCHSSNS